MTVLSYYPKKALAFLVLVFFAVSSPGALPEKGISVALKANSSSVYVHAQLIVTIEIKTALALRNGTLGKLDIKDAVIEAISEDEQDEVTENGVVFQIFKRVYAIFPNKAGTLAIPNVNFEGLVAKEASGFFPGFFSQGKRVATRSNALSIQVKDVPSSYPKGQPFLPLKHLEISDTFSEPDPKFEVNKATTRRFDIKAIGNLSSALPTLAIPRIKGLQIYAEAGEKTQNATAEGISSQTSLAHVYLPTEPGSVHIPEQKVYWWDTESDQLKTTVVRSLDISVEGSAPAAVPQVAAPIAPELPEEKPGAISKPIPTPQKNNPLWPVLALLFLALWLITMIFFFITMRRYKLNEKIKQQDPVETRFKKLWHRLKEACDKQEGKKALGALNAFYREALQEGITENTAQELSECLIRLEDALYRNPNEERVKDALKYIKKAVEPLKDPKAAKPPLAPLYPL